jgi:two-component system alkaline phosphatase synthesis response regulator PhoP
MEDFTPINGSLIMLRLLIMTPESKKLTGLGESLERNGFVCSIIPYNNGCKESITRQSADLLLVEMDGTLPDYETRELIKTVKNESRLPIIALIPEEMINNLDGQLEVDDFTTSPYDARELGLRIKRLLHRNANRGSSELIRCDGLTIDLATCEVAVDGQVVELTFKEYELLKLLASHPGRVYTRETLLNKIWGYDYFGGDRTVDVHVRRLRSKIEDSTHTFIETVRNIGYRFRKGG